MKFLPDAQESAPGVLLDVEMVPTPRGYAGAPSLVSAGYAALAADSTGAAVAYGLDGSTRLFAGTTTALYEGSGGTWTDVSRGTAYSTGDAPWQFAQFGNTSLAINKSTQLQQSSSGAFADVANAPKAAVMETVGGFVLLGNCNDTGTGLSTAYGDQPHRWWCSQLFNATGSWEPSVTTQATSGLLTSSNGGIKAAKRLGEQIVFYKERAIHVGTYVGPPEVWRFDQVPGVVGTWGQSSVVSIGDVHLFIGFEDIYRFDGSRPVPIADGVREWFFDRLNKSFAYKIFALHDFLNGTVWWFYPSGSSQTLNAALIYNYRANAFGHVTIDATVALQAVTSSITYDGLGALFATYDTLPDIAYDSPFWQSAAPVLAVFQGEDLKTLTGNSAGGTMTTGWVGDPDRFSLMDRVRLRWRVKPTNATMTPIAVTELGAAKEAGTAQLNGDRFDVLQSARWHQMQVTFTGPVEVEGITPRLKAQGYE